MRIAACSLLLLALGCTPPTHGSGRRDRSAQDTGTETPGAPATGPETSTTTPPPAPTLELGTGVNAHDPLAPGQTVPLTFGGQGGFHVDISGEAAHIGTIVEVDAWVERTSDGARLAGLSSPTALQLADYDTDAGSGWFAGLRAFLEDDSLVAVCALHGTEVTACAAVEDLLDPALRAEVCVTGIAAMDAYERTWCGTP